MGDFAAVRADLLLQAGSARLGLKRPYFDLRERLRARVERPDLTPYLRQGLLFIHVPKCGGSTVEAGIGTFHGHRSATYFAAADRAAFARVWKAALVRNPFDRLASGFHYLKGHTTAPRDQAWAREMLAGIDDFPAFLRALRNRRYRARLLCWLHFLPQWYYLCNRKGEILVDHVGRLESFDAFAATVGTKLGLTLGGERKKATGSGSRFRAAFDDETSALVRDMYAEDFAVFGYSPDPAA